MSSHSRRPSRQPEGVGYGPVVLPCSGGPGGVKLHICKERVVGFLSNRSGDMGWSGDKARVRKG